MISNHDGSDQTYKERNAIYTSRGYTPIEIPGIPSGHGFLTPSVSLGDNLMKCDVLAFKVGHPWQSYAPVVWNTEIENDYERQLEGAMKRVNDLYPSL